MKQHYYDIVDDHIISLIVPKIERELPKLTQSPHVVGNNMYLSNIFTQEMFKKHNTIILESCCGTGKTYSVVQYISKLASMNEVVLSIINRKKSLFNSTTNYMDKDPYNLKENGIICVNSIMKYSRVLAEDFKNFIVYIDEIDSLIETLTHSDILTKDIKLVYSILTKIVKNCKKKNCF
jgi:Cdc6-like AAA superfamily ATPase